MICRACEGETDEAAAFCPLCGADVLLGEPWATTLGLAEEELPVRVPHAGELSECSDEELVLPILWDAFVIHCAERRGLEMMLQAHETSWLGVRLQGRETRRQSDEVQALMEGAARRLRWLGSELMGRCIEADLTAAEFAERYPQAAWACLGEYACYGQVESPAAARDAFARRLPVLLARLGGETRQSWAPEDEEYRLTFNGLLLTPFPGDGAAQMPGMDNIGSGPDCWEGTLKVALSPAVWRFWDDFSLAPSAWLLVYEQASLFGAPAWDGQGPDAALLDAVRFHAARLEKTHGVAVKWDTLQVTGLPAASLDFTHPWGERILVQRYVWVCAPQRVYLLRGVVSANAPEYVAAVRAAIAGFEVAG
jgi:hypothetical protein